MILKNCTKATQRRPRRAAFTLMEMLVVVAIIVVLAGIGGAYFMGRLEESRVNAAKLQAEVLSKAVQQYKVDHNEFPTDLSLLLQKDADGHGPYLERADALLDPWGRQYQYDINGSNNTRVGAVVQIPDVFTMPPGGTMMVGNWKEPKH